MKSIDENSFHTLMENYLHPFHLGQTAQDVLQEFIDIDVTDNDLQRILTSNPVYHHLLNDFVYAKSMGHRSEEAEIPAHPELLPCRRLLSLLGLVGSRNLILALRLAKATSGEFPRNLHPQSGFKAEAYLPHALKVEEICLKNQLLHSEAAYAAGYLYDWAHAIGKRNGASPKAMSYAKHVFRESLGVALLSYGLARKLAGFGYMKYAFAAGLSTGLGKIILAYQFKEKRRSWVDYQTEITRRPPVNQLAALIDQRKRFQVSDGEVSSLCLGFSSVLQPVEKSLFYYQEPYYLKNSQTNAYQLAVILHTATRMSQGARTIPASVKDPLLKKWKSPWIHTLQVSDSELIEVMRWASSVQQKIV